VYIAVMALRVGRIERDLAALSERRGEASGASEQPPTEQGQR
jgi:hypothetical protein